jgi:hypothetical protein
VPPGSPIYLKRSSSTPGIQVNLPLYSQSFRIILNTPCQNFPLLPLSVLPSNINIIYFHPHLVSSELPCVENELVIYSETTQAGTIASDMHIIVSSFKITDSSLVRILREGYHVEPQGIRTTTFRCNDHHNPQRFDS